MRDTLAPYSWPRSVSWCLAEGYRKRRSAPPHGPMWLGKDFTFLLVQQLDYSKQCTHFGPSRLALELYRLLVSRFGLFVHTHAIGVRTCQFTRVLAIVLLCMLLNIHVTMTAGLHVIWCDSRGTFVNTARDTGVLGPPSSAAICWQYSRLLVSVSPCLVVLLLLLLLIIIITRLPSNLRSTTPRMHAFSYAW